MRSRLGRNTLLASCVLALAASPALVASAGPELAAPGARPIAEERLRLVLRSSNTGDWPARVRGQLADLDVHVAESELALEDGQDERIESARSLATEHDAVLVAWLESGSQPEAGTAPRAFTVVWFADSGDVYRREIGPSFIRVVEGTDSAGLELAALTVRSAVRSLLAQAVPAPAPPAALPVPPASEPVPRVPAPAQRTEPRRATQKQPHAKLELGLGAALRLTGLEEHYHLGPRLHAGLVFGRVRGSGELVLGLPNTTSVGGTEVELRQDRLTAGASVDVVHGDAFTLAPRSFVSVERTSRLTLVTAPSATSTTASAVVGFSLGGSLAASWRITFGHWVRFGVGASWAPRTVRYVSSDATSVARVVATPWPFEPGVELGWVWLP